MRWLGNATLEHLREVAELPDLTGTRYALVDRLGRGGMGVVYRVRDTELDREVALKVLSEPDPSGALAERLRREARILARLEHPNIVPVHDVGTLPDGRVFYVMKWVRGQRLDEWLHATRPGAADALRLFIKICEAVAFAHAHDVIHRDLKPQNVMVGPFGEALVMDWGLAKAVGEPAREEGGDEATHRMAGPETLSGAVLGTPAYMSPEQALGATQALDARTDVYALGALLHFLLIGVPPPESPSGTDTLRWGSFSPKALVAICLKAMARRPENRYTSAEELAADVGRLLDGLPVMAYREGTMEVAARLFTKYRAVVMLVLAYLFMRLVLLLVLKR